MDKYNFIKLILVFTTLLLIITLLLLAKEISYLSKKNLTIESTSEMELSTGLPNRSKCEQKNMEYGILNSSIQYGIIMFDLNNLKQTNDIHGHNTGDLLIFNFAKLLKEYKSTNSFIARFGGDKFIVIYDNTNERKIEENMTLNILFDEADKRMYLNKNKSKNIFET